MFVSMYVCMYVYQIVLSVLGVKWGVYILLLLCCRASCCSIVTDRSAAFLFFVFSALERCGNRAIWLERWNKHAKTKRPLFTDYVHVYMCFERRALIYFLLFS